MSTSSKPKLTTLETVINEALERIEHVDPSTEDFANATDQIVKLHKMKESETPSPLSRDTLVLCATNIAGIIMIIKHEHFNVITSKALSFVIKPR